MGRPSWQQPNAERAFSRSSAQRLCCNRRGAYIEAVVPTPGLPNEPFWAHSNFIWVSNIGTIAKQFPNKRIEDLPNTDKARISVQLYKTYNLTVSQISYAIKVSEYLVKQFLNSKDYGR